MGWLGLACTTKRSGCSLHHATPELRPRPLIDQGIVPSQMGVRSSFQPSPRPPRGEETEAEDDQAEGTLLWREQGIAAVDPTEQRIDPHRGSPCLVRVVRVREIEVEEEQG